MQTAVNACGWLFPNSSSTGAHAWGDRIALIRPGWMAGSETVQYSSASSSEDHIIVSWQLFFSAAQSTDEGLCVSRAVSRPIHARSFLSVGFVHITVSLRAASSRITAFYALKIIQPHFTLHYRTLLYVKKLRRTLCGTVQFNTRVTGVTGVSDWRD